MEQPGITSFLAFDQHFTQFGFALCGADLPAQPGQAGTKKG
jgi:hypothetical protein